MPPTREPPGRRYRHTAVLYAGRDEFLRRTVPFIRAGVAAKEPTLVLVGGEKIDRLRAALDADSANVEFADMRDVGANPALIIPAWRDFVSAHPGQSLRGIGEPIDPERSPAELIECQHHERLLNVALDDSSLYLVCPYDTRALAPEVIAEARHSHPLIVDDDESERDNAGYVGRDMASALLAEALPEPPAWAHAISITEDSMPAVREFVARRAREAGLDATRTEDLVLAAHELVTNTVRHGGGTGTLRLWLDGRELICEVRDQGRIDDPLVDRRRPRGNQAGGYGLWLANRLCDLVQLRSGPGGSIVRLHIRLG